MKVLIVEDVKLNSEILRKDLTAFGVGRIRVFQNGLDALNHLMDFTYDLLIVDLKLPDIDGVTLIKKFRGFNLTTKIILVTGTIEKEIFDRCIGLGIADILCKPYDKERLYKNLGPKPE